MKHKQQVRFYTKDGRDMAAVALAGEVCDFCSSDKVIKAYLARDIVVFENKGTPQAPSLCSDGAWAACATCAALIDEDDREGLLHRSLITFAGDIPADTSLRILQTIHDKFWEAKQ